MTGAWQAAKRGVPEAMNNVAVHLLQEDDAAPQDKRSPKRYPVPHRYFERIWKFLPG